MAREQSKKVVVKGTKSKRAVSEKQKVDKKRKVDVEYSQDEAEESGELVVADSGASIVEDVELQEENENTKHDISVIDGNGLQSFKTSGQETLNSYIRQISSFPLLSQEEEARLFDLYIDKQDQKAGQAIVMSHLRLVVKIAMQYRKFGINMMDVIAEGNVGLMIALQKFDRTKKARFSTYASLWIKAKVQEFILRSWNLVKVGSLAVRKQLLFNFSGVKKMLKITSQTDAVERDKKVADYFGISNAEYSNVVKSMTGREMSLDAPLNESDNRTSVIDTIDAGNDFVEQIQDDEEARYKKKILQESLSILNDRQREIIFARYLNDNGKATLEDLSRKYDISKERVRQIEESAIKKLKQFADEYQKKV